MRHRSVGRPSLSPASARLSRALAGFGQNEREGPGMAKAKAGGAEQGPPGPELPGAAAAAPVAALEAEVAALKQVLAGREAKVAEKRELAARVAAELAEAEREAEKGREDVAEAEERLTRQRARLDPAWRDWAGLPEHVLMKVAEKHIAQTEAGWAARLREEPYWPEEMIQAKMAERKQKLLMLRKQQAVLQHTKSKIANIGKAMRKKPKSK